ncbi:Uncharacterized protein SCF082_LOCUS51632 [Durusdinium trenchii]|uniref:Uncharacterized protein n=1 Tax=Durusdinium trenchii TaxID=1381693 RepID=A0ABP0SFL7_9DINO
MECSRLFMCVLAVLGAGGLNGCEGGCDHSAATVCAVPEQYECTELAKFGGCIKDANCCDSSDQSSEISGMTSWRKHLNQLYDASEAAGHQCEPSPCISD